MTSWNVGWPTVLVTPNKGYDLGCCARWMVPNNLVVQFTVLWKPALQPQPEASKGPWVSAELLLTGHMMDGHTCFIGHYVPNGHIWIVPRVIVERRHLNRSLLMPNGSTRTILHVRVVWLHLNRSLHCVKGHNCNLPCVSKGHTWILPCISIKTSLGKQQRPTYLWKNSNVPAPFCTYSILNT